MHICKSGRHGWYSLYDYDENLLIRTKDWKAIRQLCFEYLERTGKKDNGLLVKLNAKVAKLEAAAYTKIESKPEIKPIVEPEPQPIENPKKSKKEKSRVQKMWE